MLGLAAEQASARSQSYGTRPKTCPAALTKTPRSPKTSPRLIPSNAIPRIPLPNTIDPISKEVKYGDPHHRQCVPTYRPASAYLPRDNYSKYNDKTHTSARTIRCSSGMIWAIPHPLTPTGYKAPGACLKFDDLTSKNYFEKKVSNPVKRMESLTKKLCPYSPTAHRNLKNEVTQSHVGIHSRDCRNASYIKYLIVSLYFPPT